MSTMKLIFAFVFTLAGSGIAAVAAELPQADEEQESYIQQTVMENLDTAKPNFEALEALEAELRARMGKYRTYERALGTFYGYVGLAAFNTMGGANLVRWGEKNPASPVPVLGAMTERFNHFRNDLTLALASNWVWHPKPGAIDEIGKIRNELASLKDKLHQHPYWYVLMVEMSIALKRDQAEIDALVDEGLGNDPANFDLVLTATAAKLSKWGGNAEMLEKWANHVIELTGQQDGITNYARIYDVALRAQYGAMLFDLAKLDWAKLMAANRELMERHPSSVHLSNVAVLACVGGNRRLTREALLHKNFSYSDVSWYNIGTTYHPYKICRKWAGEPLPEERIVAPATENP